MLTKIPQGSFFSSKKELIIKINKCIKLINTLEKYNPQLALNVLAQLKALYEDEVTKIEDPDHTIYKWFESNSLANIEEQLIHRSYHVELGQEATNMIKGLTEDVIKNIKEKATSSESFEEVVKESLAKTGSKVIPIPSNNNRLAQIYLPKKGASFMLRLWCDAYQADGEELSPRTALTVLGDVEVVSMPFISEVADEDEIGITYLEGAPFYQRGSLSDYFALLRSDLTNKHLRMHNLDRELLGYTRDLLEFFIILGQKKTKDKKSVFYTDLKPKNILLDDNNNLKISDIKGFTLSADNLADSRKINTSRQYYDDSAFTVDKKGKKKLNLKRLQCQTLATTLYELITGNPPAGDYNEDLKFKLNLDPDKDFTAAYFTESKMGPFFKALIIDLMNNQVSPLSLFLNRVQPLTQVKLIVDKPSSSNLAEKIHLASSPNSNRG